MSHSVFIFSTDKLRGGIIKEILQRHGIEALWAGSILDARDAFSTHTPTVAILDTKDSLAGEIDFLQSLSRTLHDLVFIVLGIPSVISTFKGPGVHAELCLADPLDPELIVSKVKESLLAQSSQKNNRQDRLENDLKQFLKL
jgi:DNA-binding response OmpR family regulator